MGRGADPFFLPLRSHELFTGDDVEVFKEVRTLCLQLYPRLMNFAPGNADSEPGMAVVTFAPEIESECDALYKRMYDQDITVDNVVLALQRAKDSDNSHDHEFLACFLHGLFDEHRWFNTYPANELTLTAHLFGDLIQHQLIDFIPLGIAVRYVLDALRNPPESNWFSFGIQALERFQRRLAEWPQLAHSILQIPHVQQLHPDIAATARNALQGRDANAPATGPGENGFDLPESAALALELVTQQQDEVPAFTAIHVDRTGEDEPQAPDEDTSDKILFIVNNLAMNNLEAKVGEMNSRIDPVHFAWFAHYLVAQRVSIEPNNHALYHKFLDQLAMPLLGKRVLYETFVKLAALLNSEKTVQSSTERTLLKNLGSWLGGLTVAKNKPIKQQNIAFKELLIQGYDSNRLIVAIPFVCKVLEQCAKSRVFRPPNPWLMAILRLLVELYQFAELKLNLKFEIEVLCKTLNVDLKDVEPTDILRNRPKEPAPVEEQLSLAAPPPNQGGDGDALAAASRSFGPPGVLSTDQNRPQAPALMLGSQAGYSLSLQGAFRLALLDWNSSANPPTCPRHHLGRAPVAPEPHHVQSANPALREQQRAQAARLCRDRPRRARDHRARRRALGHDCRHLDARAHDEGLCDGGRRGQDGHRGAPHGPEPRGLARARDVQGAAPDQHGHPHQEPAPPERLLGAEHARAGHSRRRRRQPRARVRRR